MKIVKNYAKAYNVILLDSANILMFEFWWLWILEFFHKLLEIKQTHCLTQREQRANKQNRNSKELQQKEIKQVHITSAMA
jgi:hypothetical protein